MGNRLYVGNLSFNTSREAIEALFATAGQVREVAIPTDRETGQPRGFAFVAMGTPQEANGAIAQLDGAMLDGRALRVSAIRALMVRPESPSRIDISVRLPVAAKIVAWNM